MECSRNVQRAGGGKWSSAHTDYLRGADVVILPDNDDSGREHAEAVAHSLDGVAARIRILELPGLDAKGDIIDWAKVGGTREQLDALAEQARDWCPQRKTNEAPAPIAPRSLISRRASQIVPRDIEFLWNGRLARGKHTCIGGEPGSGKSQLSFAIAAAITTGGRWPCNEGCAPVGNVIIFNAEDDADDTIIPRLQAAGADLNRIEVVSAVTTKDGKGHATATRTRKSEGCSSQSAQWQPAPPFCRSRISARAIRAPRPGRYIGSSAVLPLSAPRALPLP
jgi:putative DNA primase/helicase